MHCIQVSGGKLRRLAAGKKGDAGNRGRNRAQQALHRGGGDLRHRSLLRAIQRGEHHVGLEQHAFEQHALAMKLAK